jgi:hypothetical protein
MLNLSAFFSKLKDWRVQTRGYCWWREDEPVRQFVLYEINFTRLDVLKLNPEGWDRFGWRPPWLGGIILTEGLHDWRRHPLPRFQLYSGICPSNWVKARKICQRSRLVLDYSLRRLVELWTAHPQILPDGMEPWFLDARALSNAIHLAGQCKTVPPPTLAAKQFIHYTERVKL